MPQNSFKINVYWTESLKSESTGHLTKFWLIFALFFLKAQRGIGIRWNTWLLFSPKPKQTVDRDIPKPAPQKKKRERCFHFCLKSFSPSLKHKNWNQNNRSQFFAESSPFQNSFIISLLLLVPFCFGFFFFHFCFRIEEDFKDSSFFCCFSLNSFFGMTRVYF